MSAPARACETRRGRQPFERCVVIHIAIHVALDDLAAVPVAGVLAIADVGHHQQLRHLLFDGADGALHNAVVGVGARGGLVLRLREAEQNDAADAERLHLRALAYCFVDRHLAIARHGADLAAHALARADKQRQDELRGRSRVSRTRRRMDSLERRRRRRWMGKGISSNSTPAKPPDTNFGSVSVNK